MDTVEYEAQYYDTKGDIVDASGYEPKRQAFRDARNWLRTQPLGSHVEIVRIERIKTITAVLRFKQS